MKIWLAQHLDALIRAGRRLAMTPFNTLLSLIAIGIMLALPASSQMLLGNTLRFVRDTEGPAASTTAQISLFMQIEAERRDSTAMTAKLKEHPGIAALRFVSRDETLKRMQDDPSLRDVLSALPHNPYPDTFIITPHDDNPVAMERLRDELAQWPGVEHVQLDSAWVRRLDAMLRLGRMAVALLGALLGVGLVAIVFTTLRLQVLAQRAEIEVCQMLGATDAYIRRPFHYFGLLQGLAGGLVAWGIVYAITLALRLPVAELAALYGVKLALQPLPLGDSLSLFGLAAGLGWFGAALSVGRTLRHTGR